MKVEVHQKSEEDAERDDARSEWLRHPFTQSLKQHAERSVKDQLDQLLSACSKSSDPEVRSEYQKYVERKATLVLFERGGKR